MLISQEQTAHFKELLHVLSHDLSNPVHSAQSLILAYEQDIVTEKEFVTYLRLSLSNATQIIEANRQMMVIDEGKIVENLSPCNLKEMWEECVFLLSEKIKRKEVNVTLDIADELVFLGEKSTIINSIFNNALTNAIKFSYREAKIEVTARKIEEWVEITIKDFGTGISEDLIHDLWNPNIPTSTSGTEDEPGTGYGMPLMKKFMDFFHGTIDIKSNPIASHPSDHGTSLTLKFSQLVN